MSTISNTGKTISICLDEADGAFFDDKKRYTFHYDVVLGKHVFNIRDAFDLEPIPGLPKGKSYKFSRKNGRLYITWGSGHFPTIPFFKRCKFIASADHHRGIPNRFTFTPVIISRVEKFVTDEFVKGEHSSASPSVSMFYDAGKLAEEITAIGRTQLRKHQLHLQAAWPSHGRAAPKSTITIKHDGKEITRTVTAEQVARILMSV